MKLKHLFYFQAIFAALSGIGFLLSPSTMWNAWGTPSEGPVMDLAGRNTGVFLVTVGFIAFAAARSANSPLRRQLNLAFLLLQGLGFIVYVLPLLTGGPTFGPAWVLSLVLTLAFAYFYFFQPE